MIIKELRLKNFKNYSEANISLDQHTTILTGDNGSGKTNFLEAIYYLQTLKPLRNGELIRWGDLECSIQSTKTHNDLQTKYSLFLSADGKDFKIGDKKVKRIDEFLKGNSVIAFLPQHLWIIKGGPGYRRDYLDRAVFNYDFSYLQSMRNYKKVLNQRNAHLKLWTKSVDKEVWDEELIKAAILVIESRLKFIKKIAPLASEIYSLLSSSSDRLTLSYDMSKDDLKEGDKIANKGQERLFKIEREERARQYSLWGPHRHDLNVFLEERLVESSGSQGEQRLAILSLKLAELELLRQYEIYPLILLDDLASELDPTRRSLIMMYLQNYKNQVVLTACDPSQWPLNSAKTVTSYYVTAGRINDF